MDRFAFEELRTEILSCQKCGLATTRNHVVFGEGNPEAEILIIGEGPGAEEDRTGRPFVGRSGKLLDKILDACGFNRTEHVFIANIVKCRPPNNRPPMPEERIACMPYLDTQIEMIDPKMVILLGATALSMVDAKARITKVRGNWIIWNNRLVMPTFHPSALLRNPNLKKDSWEDFKKVVYKYRELVNPNHFSEHIK